MAAILPSSTVKMWHTMLTCDRPARVIVESCSTSTSLPAWTTFTFLGSQARTLVDRCLHALNQLVRRRKHDAPRGARPWTGHLDRHVIGEKPPHGRQVFGLLGVPGALSRLDVGAHKVDVF